MKELNYTEADKDVLRAVFAARVALARKTEDEAATEARAEHKRTITWIASASEKEQSFLWYCDIFDLDPGAVRRAIQERKS